MAKIRWRLVVGLVSLGATVILTVPAMGAARQPNIRDAVSRPSTVGAVADVIWPNGATLGDTIWPNGVIVDGASGGTSSP
jgi:hypothetical protein